jgi:rubredoxin
MTQHAPCPKCASQEAKKVNFTWWGGMLGPRTMNHVLCKSCGTAYNGKTGESNDRAIAKWKNVRFENAPCPKCASQKAKAIEFTWWGGLLGPRMLNHVKCTACGMAYNGKTGKSNRQAITIYTAVATVVAAFLMAVILPLLMAVILRR